KTTTRRHHLSLRDALPISADGPGRRQPAPSGHVDVHQHHVRSQGPGLVYRIEAVHGLAHDDDVFFHLQYLPQSLAHEGVIVRDEDRKSTRLNSSHVKISYA